MNKSTSINESSFCKSILLAYMHMGATTTRFFKVTDRMVEGVKRNTSLAVLGSMTVPGDILVLRAIVGIGYMMSAMKFYFIDRIPS